MFGHPLPESPWGTLLAVYFILIGISSGITLQLWWTRPRDSKAADSFEWYGGLVAAVALGIASIILIIDLGQPQRFFLMLTSFSNLGSPMAVGAKLLALKSGLLALYLFLLFKRRQAHAAGDSTSPVGATATLYRVVPVLLGISSFGLAVYPATLLSRTWISPMAMSPAASVIFLCTAMAAGAAIAVILAHVVPGLADQHFRARIVGTLVFLVAIQGLLFIFEGLALHGNVPALSSSLNEMISGRWSRTFWGLVVVAGLVVPLVTLVGFSRHRIAVIVGATGVLIGTGAARYLFFIVH
ncbi:MAG: polysulfide reductase NrfD [Deltaproteobacteria bacterium]|nr:polysulfide reductase NrfD [Deltaproteobacteria bacterium]MDQ3297326.1 polysulfide reductase NrfD [Myxococcota bacterium]